MGILAAAKSMVKKDKLQVALDRIEELEYLAGLTLLKPKQIHFTRQQARLVGLLLTRGVMHVVSREMIFDYLYGGLPECDQPLHNAIDALIHQLRKIVKPYGNFIKSEFGEGWYLTEEGAEKLLELTDYMRGGSDNEAKK
jgi:DNA-binding response OmpR family regulator